MSARPSRRCAWAWRGRSITEMAASKSTPSFHLFSGEGVNEPTRDKAEWVVRNLLASGLVKDPTLVPKERAGRLVSRGSVPSGRAAHRYPHPLTPIATRHLLTFTLNPARMFPGQHTSNPIPRRSISALQDDPTMIQRTPSFAKKSGGLFAAALLASGLVSSFAGEAEVQIHQQQNSSRARAGVPIR